MKVICKKRIIRGLELKEVETLRVEQQEYPVTVGKEYRVMGLMIAKRSNCLYYLIDDDDRIWWYPYMLFEISDNSLPDNWYIKLNDKEGYLGDIFYVSGFYELCNDEDYYDALNERKAGTVDTYYKRKREYEQEEEYQYLIELGKKGV